MQATMLVAQLMGERLRGKVSGKANPHTNAQRRLLLFGHISDARGAAASAVRRERSRGIDDPVVMHVCRRPILLAKLPKRIK